MRVAFSTSRKLSRFDYRHPVLTPSSQHIALARSENQRERKNILQLAEAPLNSLDIPTLHAGKIPNTDAAKETAAKYKNKVLLDAQAAISVQANANRESVLRLFN